MADKKTHQQFIDELLIKNEYYRNGDFTILNTYCGILGKILVKNSYGLCEVSAKTLLLGNKITIGASLDKVSYFKNMCIQKFGITGNDDLSKAEYVNDKTKITVIDEFGEYNIFPSDYLRGSRSMNRLKKERSVEYLLDQDYVFKKIKDLNPELELLPDQKYIGVEYHLYTKDKYGILKSTAGYLLKGRKPCIRSAVDRAAYFIEQAKEVHGDKYDYSLTKFVNHKTPIDIIGPYGLFSTTPFVHLRGHSCMAECHANVRNNPTGWGFSMWKDAAERSKHFDGYKIYFIECWNEEERFFKIGKTYNTLAKRFVGKYNMPYKYSILYTIELDDAKRICELEHEYKNKHKEFKYLPTKKFYGMHECFSKIVYI